MDFLQLNKEPAPRPLSRHTLLKKNTNFNINEHLRSKNKSYKKNNFKVKKNENEFLNNKSFLSTSRKKYWNEIKFLFNLNKYEKQFLNNIKEKNDKKFYAIDKLWLDKFKSSFEYELLKNHLLEIINNNFEQVINKLPNDYIKKLMKKIIHFIIMNIKK